MIDKNIVIVFWHLGLGGVQKKIVDLSHYIKNKEYHLHILLRDKPRFRIDRYLNKSTATVHYRPTFLRGNIRVYFPFYILWKLLMLNPTTALAFLDAASIFTTIAAKLLFWKRIHVVLNEDTLPSKHTISPIKRLLINICYPFADIIISPTQATKRDLVSNFQLSANKIVVIPNWTTAFKSQLPHKYSYDLLYAGRFAAQKNIIFLLKSILQLKKHKSNIRACLIGEGEEWENIHSFIQQHKLHHNITILKSVYDISRFLQSAKIFALTSYYEGMPVVLLEAMAVGMTVVVKKFPGVEEYLYDGKTGFIENNLHMFSRKVLQLLKKDTLRQRVGNAAAKDVKRRFSKNAINKFFHSLISAHESSLS